MGRFIALIVIVLFVLGSLARCDLQQSVRRATTGTAQTHLNPYPEKAT